MGQGLAVSPSAGLGGAIGSTSAPKASWNWIAESGAASVPATPVSFW